VSIADLIASQLEQHGYNLTDAEARDVAAQIAQAQYEHPIAKALSAQLALVEHGITKTAPWFYESDAREARAVIVEWASEHMDAVYLEHRAVGIVVTHRETFANIVTLYPTSSPRAVEVGE
jgi:hypothetical protein